MSHWKNRKLSEKQLSLSWKGIIDFSSTHLAANVGEPSQHFLEIIVGSEKKRIQLLSVKRISSTHFEYEALYVSPKGAINGCGYWEVNSHGKVKEIEFFAHSVSLDEPRQSHV